VVEVTGGIVIGLFLGTCPAKCWKPSTIHKSRSR
jgi:hypothetical protein